MEKKTYQTPEMEITRFDAEDIIRTSGPDAEFDYGLEVFPDEY